MVTAELWTCLLAQLKAAGIEDAEWDLDQIFYIALGRHYRALDPVGVLNEGTKQKLRTLVCQRAEHHPLQYLAGEWDFYNITLKLGPGVLIPRPDTEIIVEQSLRLLQGKTAPRVLDLCAGTGAIGCAIAHNRLDAQVTAVELSVEALGYLRKNAHVYGVTARAADVRAFHAICPESSADLIVSNPPYVTRQEYEKLAPELFFEPEMALVAERDGLDFYYLIAKEYQKVLAPDGWLCFEVGAAQGEAVSGILSENGYTEISVWPDLSGLSRCVTAKKRERSKTNAN